MSSCPLCPANESHEDEVGAGFGAADWSVAFVASERAGGERRSDERARVAQPHVASGAGGTPLVVLASEGELRVERHNDGWVVAGVGFDGLQLVNEFLGYLVDRNYSPLTVRAYAFDLLHFAR